MGGGETQRDVFLYLCFLRNSYSLVTNSNVNVCARRTNRFRHMSGATISTIERKNGDDTSRPTVFWNVRSDFPKLVSVFDNGTVSDLAVGSEKFLFRSYLPSPRR